MHMNFTWTFLLVSMASLMAVAAPVAAQQEESGAERATDEISESPSFERYKTILDRMPFGEPPPNYDPTQPPGSASAAAAAAGAAAGEMTEAERTEEQQRVASAVRVSVLNVNPAGQTMVGFTDSSVQPPEHHYIPVGVRRDGWLVKSVDASQVDDEKITLEAPKQDTPEEFDEEVLHMRQLLKSKLVDMDLSVRALNCLKSAEVETLGELVVFNKNDLLKFRNFGKKSLSELDELLEKLNLSFGMDISKYKLDKD